jgi:beta-N-acetylhexosaminidase
MVDGVEKNLGGVRAIFRLMLVLLPRKESAVFPPSLLTGLTACALLFCTSCGRGEGLPGDPARGASAFRIGQYFSQDPEIDRLVDSVFATLDDTARVAQKIVIAAGRLGKPDAVVESLILRGRVGGVLLLNGSLADFARRVNRYDSLAGEAGAQPLLYSADAEPSLINRKISGTRTVPRTADIRHPDTCRAVAGRIAADLLSIGVRHNYAPVLDLGQANAAIRDRSFSSDPDSALLLSRVFAATLQDSGIMATVKHFPGHGRVQGDTHRNLVYIRDSLEEAALYAPLIRDGILSIMVGHIAIEGDSAIDTGGLPASCSKKVIQDLLRRQMGFTGLVVSDAMNMGALEQVSDAGLMAAAAGCDLLLMLPEEEAWLRQVLGEMTRNPQFREEIYRSVRRILRAKVCLNLYSGRDRIPAP